MGVVDFCVEFVVDFWGRILKKTCPKLEGFLDGSFGVKAPSNSGESIKDSDPRFFCKQTFCGPKNATFSDS